LLKLIWIHLPSQTLEYLSNVKLNNFV
jgi:hypothetical protein